MHPIYQLKLLYLCDIIQWKVRWNGYIKSIEMAEWTCKMLLSQGYKIQQTHYNEN